MNQRKLTKNCLLNQKNQKLSGGEKVQKRLATLFSEYPTGVILDEPTTHLDKRTSSVVSGRFNVLLWDRFVC